MNTASLDPLGPSEAAALEETLTSEALSTFYADTAAGGEGANDCISLGSIAADARRVDALGVCCCHSRVR